MPNFSVLLSVYYKESPDFFRQCLKSIENQTILPNEYILVEDGPLTPELDCIIQEFSCNHPELKIIKITQNVGLGNALNEGLRHCSYELVARMDTDDISKANRFEKQLEIFKKYPMVDVVSSWIEEFLDNPNNVVSIRKLPEFQYQIYQFAKKRCPINHPAVMFKKSSVLFAGGYQHIPLFEDYFLWIRLLMNGACFYNLQESLLMFRTSSDMYKRRGGLKHAVTEFKFQNQIRNIGFISWGQFFYNIIVRFITRILPNQLRKFIYQKFLR